MRVYWIIQVTVIDLVLYMKYDEGHWKLNSGDANLTQEILLSIYSRAVDIFNKFSVKEPKQTYNIINYVIWKLLSIKKQLRLDPENWEFSSQLKFSVSRRKQNS